MNNLKQKEKQRLFTYKVRYDNGTAPHPFCGVCSLAICKPRIRSVAKIGDIVAGFSCGRESTRLVYVMQVAASLPWATYIKVCNGQLKITEIEGGNIDGTTEWGRVDWVEKTRLSGDCIYLLNPDASVNHKPIDDSLSKHDESDFEADVCIGKNVLLSYPDRYWYFGDGKTQCLDIPHELSEIIPNRGHRSNANNKHINKFIDWFNSQDVRHEISFSKNKQKSCKQRQ